MLIVLHFLRIRVPYPFQWGAPTFDAGEAFAMMAASFVALVEVCVLLLFSFLSFYNLMQYLFWILLNIWQIKLMFDLIILMQVL